MIKSYCRIILETGDMEWQDFNENHAREATAFMLDGKRGYFIEGQGISPYAALFLMNKWNHSARYKYTIDTSILH